jgi:hypothetical protein
MSEQNKNKTKAKESAAKTEYKPIRLDFEEVVSRDPTFQPIKPVARVWGTDRKKVRRVVAQIVLTYRNHPTLIPGRPVWQARDAETSSPIAESFESPEALREVIRQHYIKRRTKS